MGFSPTTLVVNVDEEMGEIAQICVELRLTAPLVELGCDATVTLDVIPDTAGKAH